MADVGHADIEKAFRVLNIDLHTPPSSDSILRYFEVCKALRHLHVTTSCFTIWKEHKNTNGYAKVIPALPRQHGVPVEERIKVFFFDDNIEFPKECGAGAPGICNLRHYSTGEFVDFSIGANGFKREYEATHTVCHYSEDYANILVKANILDAMSDGEYFTKMIRKHSEPGEKLIVYMDVNSTIICHDTMTGKDVSAVVLSTMFEVIELTPREAFDFTWESFPPVRLEKSTSLKQLVKKATDRDGYNAFWTEANCRILLEMLWCRGEVRWAVQDCELTLDNFNDAYQEYLVACGKDVDRDGIVSSWYTVFDYLKDRHATVLNSFGVDCRKVILATVPNEREVQHIVVNYEQWDARDMKKFESQFAEEPSVLPNGKH